MVRKLVCLILLTLIAKLVLPTDFAFACSPPLIPWFLEEWQVTPNDFLAGILFEVALDGSGKNLRLTNKTNASIYLLDAEAKFSPTAPSSFEKSDSFDRTREIAPDDSLVIGYPYSYAHGVMDVNYHANQRRPVNVEIPSPQDSYFGIIYESKYYTMPVRLTYTLDPNYKYTGLIDCPYPSNNGMPPWGICIGCLVGFVIVGSLVGSKLADRSNA